jgi:urate oxidase
MAGNLSVTGGIRGLEVLKTTQSAFRGYHKDRYTTLEEVNDRLMGTSVEAKWSFCPSFVSTNPRFDIVSASVEEKLVNIFCGPSDTGVFSESVQETCYSMGRAVLMQHEGITSITLAMPNLHNLPFPLEKYGYENKDHTGNPDIFYPIDEPHGMISVRKLCMITERYAMLKLLQATIERATRSRL